MLESLQVKRAVLVLAVLSGCPSGAMAQDMTFSTGSGGDMTFTRSAYFGVRVTELTPESRGTLGAPGGFGVLVAWVEADGPAASAGLKVGDVLLAVAGHRIDIPFELSAQAFYRRPGDDVLVHFVRAGRRHSLHVRLGYGRDVLQSISLPEPTDSRP